MTGRLNFLADPGLAEAGARAEACLNQWLAGLDEADYGELIDPLARKVLHGAFQWVGADEGTVWLIDGGEENLVAAYNSGPRADELTGHRQPIGRGIVSLVFANERSYCENEIAAREAHDDTVDRKLGTRTEAMLATPFYFANALRGVISCVQLSREDGSAPPGFDTRHAEELAATGAVLDRMITGRLLAAALGLDHA
ncbi:MAG: GAF domain-containing protein [Verrucomicrobiae bacterium]|nr:GAF domain-containing protein [Verrucomicrobiae bacterium]MCP5540733.1 GAF domain-containing protein [Akkermansiaceae bacterium]